MRAAACPDYGPPEVVRIGDQRSPDVAAGQLRVRVGAAAVNFPDVLLIANQYQISVPPPFVPAFPTGSTNGPPRRSVWPIGPPTMRCAQWPALSRVTR
jgi:hypothetical protein